MYDGYKIPFDKKVTQLNVAKLSVLNDKDYFLMNKAISKLIDLGAILQS